MAYVDQQSGGNQRAAIAGVVAIIQGAAIVALIHGFTVHYFDRPDDSPLAGEQINITPPPEEVKIEKTKPVAKPSDDYRKIDSVKPPIDFGAGGTTIVIDTFPVDTRPVGPTQDRVEVQKPVFTPTLAKPRTSPGNWVTPNDYPAADLRAGNQGVTEFTLTIGTDGRVQSCRVTSSSGYPRLDRATCDNVSRRARFEPATDGNGNLVSGTYSNRIRWEIPQG